MPLSIIIPVGPSDTTWRLLLPDLAPLGPDSEIVLVATQGKVPADFTPDDYGLRAPTRWIDAPAGRAAQLNAGARTARGATLCFLHADSRLPNASLHTLLARDIDASGVHYFDLAFLPDGPRLMAINRLGAFIRSRWLAMPFGDQGLTLSRDLFDRLNGFDVTIACGEDHDLVWRARRAGAKIVPLRAPILTSARKYAERGWWRTTARHLWLTARQAGHFSRRTPGP